MCRSTCNNEWPPDHQTSSVVSLEVCRPRPTAALKGHLQDEYVPVTQPLKAQNVSHNWMSLQGLHFEHFVESTALRYKQESRGFDSRCWNWIFSLT
jgi:hypothetical protein